MNLRQHIPEQSVNYLQTVRVFSLNMIPQVIFPFGPELKIRTLDPESITMFLQNVSLKVPPLSYCLLTGQIVIALLTLKVKGPKRFNPDLE